MSVHKRKQHNASRGPPFVFAVRNSPTKEKHNLDRESKKSDIHYNLLFPLPRSTSFSEMLHRTRRVLLPGACSHLSAGEIIASSGPFEGGTMKHTDLAGPSVGFLAHHFCRDWRLVLLQES